MQTTNTLGNMLVGMIQSFQTNPSLVGLFQLWVVWSALTAFFAWCIVFCGRQAGVNWRGPVWRFWRRFGLLLPATLIGYLLRGLVWLYRQIRS